MESLLWNGFVIFLSPFFSIDICFIDISKQKGPSKNFIKKDSGVSRIKSRFKNHGYLLKPNEEFQRVQRENSTRVLFVLSLTRFILDFFSQSRNMYRSYCPMSSTSPFWHVKFWVFVLIFSIPPACRKQQQIFDFQNSLHPNRWAAEGRSSTYLFIPNSNDFFVPIGISF